MAELGRDSGVCPGCELVEDRKYLTPASLCPEWTLRNKCGSAKETINKMKRQPTEWEKALYPKYIKNSYNSIVKMIQFNLKMDRRSE